MNMLRKGGAKLQILNASFTYHSPSGSVPTSNYGPGVRPIKFAAPLHVNGSAHALKHYKTLQFHSFIIPHVMIFGFSLLYLDDTINCNT